MNLDDALNMITSVGALINKKANALKLVNEIKAGFEKLKSITTGTVPKSVLYLIWHNPYMAVGSETFINDMLSASGFVNAIATPRYPNIDIEELTDLAPDIIFLSSEPFPFKQKHIDELQKVLPNTIIEMIDGEMYSWYGSRLKKSPIYFETLFKKLNSVPLSL